MIRWRRPLSAACELIGAAAVALASIPVVPCPPRLSGHDGNA